MNQIILFILSSKFYRIWTVVVCIIEETKQNLVVICITEICPNLSPSLGYVNFSFEETDTHPSTWSLSQPFPYTHLEIYNPLLHAETLQQFLMMSCISIAYGKLSTRSTFSTREDVWYTRTFVQWKENDLKFTSDLLIL